MSIAALLQRNPTYRAVCTWFALRMAGSWALTLLTVWAAWQHGGSSRSALVLALRTLPALAATMLAARWAQHHSWRGPTLLAALVELALVPFVALSVASEHTGLAVELAAVLLGASATVFSTTISAVVVDVTAHDADPRTRTIALTGIGWAFDVGKVLATAPLLVALTSGTPLWAAVFAALCCAAGLRFWHYVPSAPAPFPARTEDGRRAPLPKATWWAWSALWVTGMFAGHHVLFFRLASGERPWVFGAYAMLFALGALLGTLVVSRRVSWSSGIWANALIAASLSGLALLDPRHVGLTALLFVCFGVGAAGSYQVVRALGTVVADGAHYRALGLLKGVAAPLGALGAATLALVPTSALAWVAAATTLLSIAALFQARRHDGTVCISAQDETSPLPA